MKHPLDPTHFPSLTDAEAATRLALEGPNQLPSAEPKSLLAIAMSVLKEPMLLLLLAGGTIYFLLGDKQEALVLLGFVFLIIAITLVQERKTERALEALRDLSSPRALVIRAGRERRIAGRDVARGDLLVLAEGDRVPADAVVLSTLGLSADESLLTGESVPVRKTPGEETTAMGRPGGEDQPFVFSGTLIVKGQALARVKAIGSGTEMGRIGIALEQATEERTLLEIEVRRIVKVLTATGLLLCALLVLVYGLMRGGWLEGLLAGLTLAMAVLPEEFPVVLTVFMALGAWRISQRRVLTRRLPALETLGAATVLCTDKTGTLTMNRMAVRKLWANGRAYDVSPDCKGLPEELHEVVEYTVLASQRDPFDPMEIAIKELGERALRGTEHLHGDWILVREYPLSAELLSLSHVHRSPEGSEYVIAAKGAPEAIFDLCHLDEDHIATLSIAVERMATEGLRVLGVARATFRLGELPEVQHDFDFELVGLVGLADPIRPGVNEAVAECSRAGIRVVMITGDYPATARSIAQQIGLAEGDLITGAELDAMSNEQLGLRARKVTIFARVVPEQKLRIVEAMKGIGEIVAMTGDGVNDAPALKAAHIGIAMGGRGTDVAREAAALVLTDDDFSSIVDAIRLGRRVFDNLKKAMAYIVAVHVPIAGMSLLPVLFGFPLVLSPIHVAVLEMIIDPACSVVFEAELAEEGVMKRPPRKAGEPLLGRSILLLSVLQGGFALLAAMAVLSFALTQKASEATARGLAFSTLVFGNLGLILANRSLSVPLWTSARRPNIALWVTFAGATLLLALALNVPFLQSLFDFAPPSVDQIGIAVTVGLASVAWFEFVKFARRRIRGAA